MERRDSEESSGLWVIGPNRLERRPSALSPLAPGLNRVRTFFSGISRGTERLVLEGRVPEAEYQRMACPRQRGQFPYPVLYGYAAVGRVEEGALSGQLVFCLNPHETLFDAPVDWLVPVPSAVPARRAVLAANLETALNAIWDSGAGPGDRILVVGGGVVGGLISALAARLPGAEVTLVDPLPARASLAQTIGCAWQADGQGLTDYDVVFHTSAHESGLATAIAAAGREARIVELSWYGAGSVAAPLGGAFHALRLTLQSSQVGEIAPSRRPRWTHRRRIEKALSLLADPVFDAFITHEIRFADADARLPAILSRDTDALMPVLVYGD
jgi:NADPH:quinone reductase-like Zn-dependent oxidoreductase